MPSQSSLYVQFGCGMSAPPGWRNFDASPTLRFERIPVVGQLYQKNASRFPANAEYGDILRRLPVRDGSVRAVFASHVLEHLALDDFRLALRNTYAMLQPGGMFRLIVPDLEQLTTKYLANGSTAAASEYIRAIGMGLERRPRGLFGLAQTALGNSRHQWMWDYKSMSEELSAVGFVDVRRAYAGDSSDARFIEVEDPDRFGDSIGVECRKP